MADNNGISLFNLLEQVKELARQYYLLTEKPLGVTGEIGEYEAARILDLTLAEARTPGHDATDKKGFRYQIKARRLLKNNMSGETIGKIGGNENWDLLLVVLLDERFDAFVIYEADKDKVIAELDRPGSASRNERRALTIPVVKRIGRVKWSRCE